LAHHKNKTTSAVVLYTISAELTEGKSYQAGCLAYYKYPEHLAREEKTTSTRIFWHGVL